MLALPYGITCRPPPMRLNVSKGLRSIAVTRYRPHTRNPAINLELLVDQLGHEMRRQVGRLPLSGTRQSDLIACDGGAVKRSSQ
jgi:hypothetical protein